MNITLQHLTKTFPARGRKAEGETTAVRDLSFTVPDGQLVGLLGPSGCGKSTTLNMICGLETPTSGKILFGEEDVTALPPELRGVGMVFQNYALYPHLTVMQNILFPLQNLKGDKRPLPRRNAGPRAQGCPRLSRLRSCLTANRASFRAGSSSGSRLPGRWSRCRGFCCLMNRFPTWTPGWAAAKRAGGNLQNSETHRHHHPLCHPRPRRRR